jgi:hypothetical protein
MSNPFRSFKYLPWSALFQSAGLTVLISMALDILLLTALAYLPQSSIANVVIAALLLVLPFVASFGVGALAIFLASRFFRQILLRADTIWALVGCVLLFLFLKSWLPSVPSLFVGFDYFSVMAVIVGAFTAGRRYWRY